MQKILRCTVVLLLLLGTHPLIKAQTFHEHYQDGKIWFKIKDNVPVMHTLGTPRDQKNLALDAFPFLSSLRFEFNLTKLSRPFHMVKNEKKLSNVFLLEFTDIQNTEHIIRSLMSTGKVEYAEKVPLLKPTLTPNDPSYNSSTQWGLFKINAANAWNVSTGNTSIKVAIVDDAVKITHPDLAGNIWTNTAEIANNGIDDDANGYIDDRQGYDVADDDNNPNPPTNSFDHGTHVAGISAAVSNNNGGIASIGYNVKIMAVKSTDQATLVTHGYDGIVYSVINNADVINMSWGGQGTSTTAQNIITWASNQGCLLVAAAGNDGVSSIFYPAGYTEVIAVAATGTTDAKTSFSNYGTWIDVSAPGSSIYSTIPANNGYAFKDGTSMASPLVAGLAALVWSVNPSLTAADVKNCILSTADNIDAVNASFIGQLGSGRINALDAVNCASATLNWPPVADFTANTTNITAGANVTFTDLSTYNPTSWSWTFAGGTPGTFNGQTPPPITYNTPGVYNVVLSASNANGTDVETKTAYITVNANNGCDTLGDWPGNPVYSPTIYSLTTPNSGYVAGTNSTGDKAKAEFFNAAPYTYLTYAYFWFGKAYSANPNKTVTIFVKDGTTSSPGANLANGTKTVTMGELMQDVNGGFLTRVQFDPPVTLPVSKQIFVGVDFSSLSYATGDTLALVTSLIGEGPGNGWEQLSTNTWQNYSVRFGGNLLNYINPIVTDVPTVATIASNTTTVCQGGSINFDATGSTGEDTLLWSFVGGAPFNSSDVQQTVFYNTPGTYKAYLEVIGGSCNAYAVDSITITVNPKPTVSVTQSADTICPAQSVNLTASGATTYVWTPSTFLNNPNIANPVSTPTSNITYTVTGTTLGCSGSSIVNIVVINADPIAAYLTDADTSCVGSPVEFNGAVSTDEDTYAWTFSSGSITGSTSASASVTWSAAGTFPVQLIVSNICGDDDTINGNVIIENCASVDELFGNDEVFATVNYNDQQVNITFNLEGSHQMKLEMMNSLGQIVNTGSAMVYAKGTKAAMSINQLAGGIYYLRVSENERHYILKFMK